MTTAKTQNLGSFELYDVASYTQEGLVLQYDGIEKGNAARDPKRIYDLCAGSLNLVCESMSERSFIPANLMGVSSFHNAFIAMSSSRYTFELVFSTMRGIAAGAGFFGGLTSGHGWDILVGQQKNSLGMYRVFIDGVGATTFRSDYVVPEGAPVSIACTFDGNIRTVYMNGVAVGAFHDTFEICNSVSSYSYYGYEGFAVRVYGICLRDEQIAQHFKIDKQRFGI